MIVKEVKEVLFTKSEAFILFPDGTIARHKGHFEEDPDHRYIRDVYRLPERTEFSVRSPYAAWLRECRNIEELNALVKQKQRKEYRKRINSIRKQWKAQQPPWFSKITARVRA